MRLHPVSQAASHTSRRESGQTVAHGRVRTKEAAVEPLLQGIPDRTEGKGHRQGRQYREEAEAGEDLEAEEILQAEDQPEVENREDKGQGGVKEAVAEEHLDIEKAVANDGDGHDDEVEKGGQVAERKSLRTVERPEVVEAHHSKQDVGDEEVGDLISAQVIPAVSALHPEIEAGDGEAGKVGGGEEEVEPPGPAVIAEPVFVPPADVVRASTHRPEESGPRAERQEQGVEGLLPEKDEGKEETEERDGHDRYLKHPVQGGRQIAALEGEEEEDIEVPQGRRHVQDGESLV